MPISQTGPKAFSRRGLLSFGSDALELHPRAHPHLNPLPEGEEAIHDPPHLDGDVSFHALRLLDFVASDKGIANSDVIAGVFVPVFERQLGHAGFVELAQTFRDHSVVLLFRCARER